jgi:hypothetical protein
VRPLLEAVVLSVPLFMLTVVYTATLNRIQRARNHAVRTFVPILIGALFAPIIVSPGFIIIRDAGTREEIQTSTIASIWYIACFAISILPSVIYFQKSYRVPR